MNYSAMYTAIVKVLNESGENIFSINNAMISQIDLWSRMYSNEAPWLSKTVASANLSASVAFEHSKLVTLELRSGIKGSAMAEYLDKIYKKDILPILRQKIEYGLAKGSLIIKPVPVKGGIRTQFIQAGRFFPISFDGSGRLSKCAFTEQIRKGRYIYTLLEIHTMSGPDMFTIENRVFKSTNDGMLGSETVLSEVSEWVEIQPFATLSGINHLPFGLFCCPMANQIDSDSPLGVSVYSRAVEHIREADRRYSGINWEYESTEAAVHISSSMLKYNKDQDKYEYPEGKERLYRAVEYNTGATQKPLIDTYSPQIRSKELYEGWNNQLRLIEFSCSLAYGTLSNPQNVDKTAEEVKSSKQRSYTFVSETQAALQKALEDWCEAAYFWSRIYNLAPDGKYEMSFEWGDSILSDPDAERENDRKDLANGTLRPEEYRAKYRDESLEDALKNLPEAASVIE